MKSYTQKFISSSQVCTTLFIEKYRSLVENNSLEVNAEAEIPGSLRRTNKDTTQALSAMLKAAAERGGERIGSKGLSYQVVMTRLGRVAGLSPANVQAITRWKEVSKSLLSHLVQAERSEMAEDHFVFLLTYRGDNTVSVEIWPQD